jgi:hypothetical protein
MGEGSARLKIVCEHAEPTAKALLSCFDCVRSDGGRGGASDKQRGPADQRGSTIFVVQGSASHLR